MPVTAKLSRRFYEALGDDVANELVEWFNQVDATYRADLRELNDLNFARFDAKLEQRIAELRAEFQSGLGALELKLSQRIVETEAHVVQQMLETKAELVRWMFVFWLGTGLTVLGMLKL